MITAGTILYEKVADRRGNNTRIEERKVMNVGTKFFYVDVGPRDGFGKKLLRYTNSNFSQYSRQLYRTRQEILDMDRHLELSSSIRKSLKDYGSAPFTLDQLERINTILNEPK